MFKGLTTRRLYKSFGVEGLIWMNVCCGQTRSQNTWSKLAGFRVDIATNEFLHLSPNLQFFLHKFGLYSFNDSSYDIHFVKENEQDIASLDNTLSTTRVHRKLLWRVALLRGNYIYLQVGFSKANLSCAAIIDENIHHQVFHVTGRIDGMARRGRPISALCSNNRLTSI
jgi:hypothetical protein